MSDVIFETTATLNGEALDINVEFSIMPMHQGAGDRVADWELTGAYYYDDETADLIQLEGAQLQQVKDQCDTESNRMYVCEKWN